MGALAFSFGNVGSLWHLFLAAGIFRELYRLGMYDVRKQQCQLCSQDNKRFEDRPLEEKFGSQNRNLQLWDLFHMRKPAVKESATQKRHLVTLSVAKCTEPPFRVNICSFSGERGCHYPTPQKPLPLCRLSERMEYGWIVKWQVHSKSQVLMILLQIFMAEQSGHAPGL